MQPSRLDAAWCTGNPVQAELRPRNRPARAARRLTVAAVLSLLAPVLTTQGQALRWDGSEREGFGRAVATAGDIDGDGFADVLVGSIGSARVFSGDGGALLYHFETGDGAGGFGSAVAGGGDVNGDGFADVICVATSGAPGDVRVYSGWDGTVLHTFADATTNEVGALRVGAAGDLNGDGYDDILVGEATDDTNTPDAGSVRAYSGRDGSLLYLFYGTGQPLPPGDGLGASVDGAGDVDADGFDDFVMGAWNHGRGRGRVWVRSGRNGTLLHTFDGALGAQLGTSVAGAGDVNGDGHADVIAGAPLDDNAFGADAGMARVWSGADGSTLHTWRGAGTARHFGSVVDGAGDVDGDGFDDLIVGSSAGSASGRVWLFSGRDGSALHVFDGDDPGDRFGSAIAGGCDVDGDGLAEIIVADIGDDDGGPDAGSVRVFDYSTARDPGRFLTYGAGCPGSDGRLSRLEGTGTLALGGRYTVRLWAAPRQRIAFLRLAGGRDRVDLAFLGAPCMWLTSLSGFQADLPTTTTPTGQASFTLRVPNGPEFVGARFTYQWWTFAPLDNPLGWIGSNAGELTIGGG